MIELTKIMDDPNGIVSKLIFEDGDTIAETVAYKFEDRGVVCFSVQSGCRVGCSFCGTGKRFIRNLLGIEMHVQVQEALKVIGERKKIQLMSMSMGEPMDNWMELKRYYMYMMKPTYPDFHFYVSTVGLDNSEALTDFLDFGKRDPNFGLQFSLHHHKDEKRKILLGNYPKLLDLDILRKYGILWTAYTGKPCYWNYIISKENNNHNAIYEVVKGMHLTCSVQCNINELSQADIEPVQEFATKIRSKINTISDWSGSCGTEVSVFNPAGQDTIGGGCGQLLFVQERMKDLGIEKQAL